MSWQLSSLIFIGIIALSLSSGIEIDSDSCPDDSWIYKEFNGEKYCYKLYVAENRIDRCGLKDVCRPLNIDAIPTPIISDEQLDFLKVYVGGRTDESTMIGVYIPCPKAYNPIHFINVDGSLITVRFDKFDDVDNQFNAMINNNLFDDVDIESGDFHTVLCAMPSQKSTTTQKSMTTQNPFSSDKCPDDSYIYKEFNGVGNCYKKYKTSNKIDQCSLINACRSLDPDAIPVTLTSNEQRDYLKTLVDPSVYTLIGVSIPCGHPCNAKAYENVDGTPLPAPLEVTADACPKQVLGMLYKNETNNLDPKDPDFHGDVLCFVPPWCST